MAATPPPGNAELARRRVVTAIRNYRIKRNLTQRDAANGLDWSLSKLLRLEQGSIPVARWDMRALMSLYKETNPNVIESMVDMAKQARTQTPYEEFHDIASRDYQKLMGLEAAAKVIYKYEPSVIPGLFQTEKYARNVSRSLGHVASEVERQVSLRMLRQARVMDGENRPELHFILGEAALRRKVGTSDVMRDQLRQLINLAKQDDVTLSMLPFAAGPHSRMGSAFTILQFDDENGLIPDALYLEGADIETINIDDPEPVKLYRELFLELYEKAEAEIFPPFEEQVNEICLSCFSRP